MSTSLGITRPNGVRLPVYYTASQDKMALVMGQLSDWEDFCNQNWLSDNHEDINCSENRVKAFLNGQAYLLLRDNSEDTLSSYKEYARGRTEIPVSSCSDHVNAMFYGEERQDDAMENDPKHNLIEYEAPPAVQSKAKPSKTNERSKRIEQIRASLPGCTFGFASIDTDNAFSHDGDTYRFDSSVEAYRPKETADGPLYDMDQVVVVTHYGERHFYTQDYFPIE